VALSGLPRLSLVALQHQRAPCLLSRAAARSSGRSRCRRRQSTGPAVTIGKRTVLILDRAGEQAVGQDPRERIFSALTESAELARWWGPHGYTTPEIDLDLRVGGGYRFTMQPPGSDRFHLAVGLPHEAESSWVKSKLALYKQGQHRDRDLMGYVPELFA
jgi:hypothetical protein